MCEGQYFCGECSQFTVYDPECGVEFEACCEWCGADLDEVPTA